MGKTTLAQYVYNEKRIAEHFDLKIWLHVFNKFDAMGLTRNMLAGAKGRWPNVESLDLLQRQLEEKLMAYKKFLLVLDDAGYENESYKCGILFYPLKHGVKGSKIFLTTRMNTVAEMVQKELTAVTMKPIIINLKGLKEHHQLVLFKEHAFAGVDPKGRKRLEPIGGDIARKLGNSPLVAKVVGNMLNSNFNMEFWKEVLCNDISMFEKGEKAIMPALKLSYHHLPENVRPCFAYCSIFPPHYEFSKDDLIYMWMAMGFIQQSSHVPGEMPEDIGSHYFDYLARRSFLEPSDPTSLSDVGSFMGSKSPYWVGSAGARISEWGPHLRMLCIKDCPELKVLPALPLSLKEMQLTRVGLTALPMLCWGWSESSSSSSSSPPPPPSSSSLSVLKIEACHQLKSLAEGLLVQKRHNHGSL